LTELGFPPVTAAAIVAVAVIGGLAHGTMGLGFPLIATPLVALLLDVKTAVLVTVIPNIAVNLLSILRGGGGAGAWADTGRWRRASPAAP
jgi:hypothetical protein